MLLDWQVRIALIEEGVFEHPIRLCERLLDITELQRHVLVNIAVVAVFVNARLGVIEPLFRSAIVRSVSYSTSIRFERFESRHLVARNHGGDRISDEAHAIDASACSSWLTGRMPYGIGRSLPVSTR